MSINIEKIRDDTPTCKQLIHFNNAGCSLIPQPVKDQYFTYLQSEQNIGGYETAEIYHRQLTQMYSSVARLINCDEDEIAFCESHTRGWQQFFYSLNFQQGGNIITSRVDYGSNFISYIHTSKKHDVEIRYIDTDDQGDLDLHHLQSLIDNHTRLISISHIPTGSGLINPAEEIGTVAAAAKIPYLLDACQSVGHLHIDVKKIKCTALSATGRKYMRGSRGTGFLYVNRDYCQNAEPAYLEQQSADLIDDSTYRLADSARRFENFECHFAGRLALKHAADYAVALGTKNVQQRIIELAAYCRSELSDIPHISVQDTGIRQCGIVTFTSSLMSPAELRIALLEKKINTWISSGPGSLIDFQDRNLNSVTRASLHYFNTDEEIQKMCSVLSELG